VPTLLNLISSLNHFVVPSIKVSASPCEERDKTEREGEMSSKSPLKSVKEPGEHTKSKKLKPIVETCPSFSRGHLPHVEDVERLRNLVAPHVDSFNYFLDVGLEKGIQDIEPVEVDIVDPQKLRTSQVDLAELTSVQFWVENVKVGAPVKKTSGASNLLLPRECRELGLTYSGEMTGSFCYRVIQRRNGIKVEGHPVRIPKHFGGLPLMVMSRACHLKEKSPAELVKLKEEVRFWNRGSAWVSPIVSQFVDATLFQQHTEFGGYFIVNGIERCIRLLQIPRRNHPMAIRRANYQRRGPTFTDLGVAMRSSRYNGDQSSITNTVHYLTTGGSSLRFVARKQEFLIPVVLILRALSGSELAVVSADAAGGFSMGVTDEELYRRIVQGDEENTFLRARAELLLQDARARFGNLNTPEECLTYIGERFRPLSMKSETSTNIEIAHFLIRRYVLIHLKSYRDKLECLLLLVRKLYAFAVGECGVDNSDSLQNQEILLPGHLISAFIKEKFEEMLQGVRLGLLTEVRKDTRKVLAGWQDTKFWNKLVERYSGTASGGIGKKFQHLLSTGNIVSTTGLDLMQVSGYTIVAEKLNFLRYVAHFRSVHRGQFFMEMKTTAVRKLLPDQWGFLCPVHTPDGGPCGLLSHLALNCSILTHPAMSSKEKHAMVDLLLSFGVVPVGAGGDGRDGRAPSSHLNLPVCLDGRVIGGAPPSLCKTIVAHLRRLKVANSAKVPCTLEVALITGGKFRVLSSKELMTLV
jgi:DNA-directed RNA polymerase I subunit RPA2